MVLGARRQAVKGRIGSPGVKEVQVLRQVWAQQFECQDAQVHWRAPEKSPPGAQLIVTPHDPEVRCGQHGAHTWHGYAVHWTETCDTDLPYLITDVLKNELGFAGFVVSDWAGIDQVDPDYYTAVVTAINAGVDMNMVPNDYLRFITTMQAAVANGDIAQERIDDAVRRILTVKLNLGLFERPYGRDDLLDVVGGDAHRALAREAVQKSLPSSRSRRLPR